MKGGGGDRDLVVCLLLFKLDIFSFTNNNLAAMTRVLKKKKKNTKLFLERAQTGIKPFHTHAHTQTCRRFLSSNYRYRTDYR